MADGAWQPATGGSKSYGDQDVAAAIRSAPAAAFSCEQRVFCSGASTPTRNRCESEAGAIPLSAPRVPMQQSPSLPLQPMMYGSYQPVNVQFPGPPAPQGVWQAHHSASQCVRESAAQEGSSGSKYLAPPLFFLNWFSGGRSPCTALVVQPLGCGLVVRGWCIRVVAPCERSSQRHP